MKKVLILFCGGTIIMEENDDGSLIVQTKKEAIQTLLNLEPKIKKTIDLDIIYVDNIDSTNMNPKHWDKIAGVLEKKYNQYDGFIITHGTDTMAYTASALSYSLNNIGKPVVLTGSQIPGGRIETDARRNFINAVRVATENLAGVFLVFDEEVILGSRASKVSESKLDAFETINSDLLGEIRIDIRLSDNRRKRHQKKLKVQKGFESNIAVITMFPGLPAKGLERIVKSGIKALVLRAYGPGNISYDYLELIKLAKKRKIPVVVDTQCLEGITLMHLYDVGNQALKAGAIQAYDMSIETVITKLMWALKHCKNTNQVKKIMHTNYTGEINKEGTINNRRLVV